MVANFNKKQKPSFSPSGILLKLGAVMFLIVAIVFIFANFQMYKKKQELVSQVNSYKEQIADLENRSQLLKEGIANSDNPDYIEKIAREESNMQKPGEKVVSFVEQKHEQKPIEIQENLWTPNFWFSWLGQSWNWISAKLHINRD